MLNFELMEDQKKRKLKNGKIEVSSIVWVVSVWKIIL